MLFFYTSIDKQYAGVGEALRFFDKKITGNDKKIFSNLLKYTRVCVILYKTIRAIA